MSFDYSQMENAATEIDFEYSLDAMERAQRLSDEFNAELEKYYQNDQTLNEINYVHPDPDYKLGGIGEVLAALQGEDDDPLEGLLRKTLKEHDMYSSPGNPYVDPERWKMFIDPCLDDEGNKTLPKWNPDDPQQSNVIFGLIASRPRDVYVFRNEFSFWAVVKEIIRGVDIETWCDLRCSVTCDPKEPREISTMANGNYIVFFRCCMSCYHNFLVCAPDGGYEFNTDDPRGYYGTPDGIVHNNKLIPYAELDKYQTDALESEFTEDDDDPEPPDDDDGLDIADVEA